MLTKTKTPMDDLEEDSDISSDEEELEALCATMKTFQTETKYALMAGEESSDEEVPNSFFANLHADESDESDSEASLEN